ncbi:MAG: type II toxin-antitoxin system VapC family toxin [Steroidobacteraceae bacterium]
MILADTSVWIDYFHEGLPELAERLCLSTVVMHPFVVGELACGNFSNRDATFELLQQLRSVTVAEHHEVLSFIRARKLYGRGIGYVDAHLLAAAVIEGCQLWTRDKRLHALAATVGVAVN